MPCHSMHTYACVDAVRQICLKIASNLLHMELTCTQVHKYDFSNRFGQALHVDAVEIRIMDIKWQLNVFRRSNDPQNFPKFHIIVLVVHVTRRKKIEGHKWKLYISRSSSNMHCSLSKPGTFQRVAPVCEGCVSKLSSNIPIFYHIILVA